MHRANRTFLVIIAILLAAGGWFSAMGATAQEQPQTAQPGGDLPGDPSLELVRVADGLIEPINLASAHDGSGRLFVLERIGYVRIIQDGQALEDPFLDISQQVKVDFLEQGLLGLAFHPDYENNGRFYVFYSDYRTNGDHMVVEYTVSEDDPNVADPESARLILAVDDPFVNHNGGTMHFGPDGYLYITIGDGGLAGDPHRNAQDISTLMGAILRIDVDVDPNSGMAYGIPPDNPFAPGGQMVSDRANEEAQDGDYHPNARPEIYVYGLRNAWQFSFDMETGDLYIADVGQVFWEEINLVPAEEVAAGGHDFGWDYLEGAHCYPRDPEDPEAESCSFVGELPVAEYQHGEDGCSITGVGVYRGETSPALDGIYFASDFCSGKFWGLARDDGGAWQFEELLDTDLLVTGAGQGQDGELYITACECTFGRDYELFDNPNGSLWQLVSSDQVPEGAVTASGAGGTPVPDEAVEDEGEDAEATPEG